MTAPRTHNRAFRKRVAFIVIALVMCGLVLLAYVNLNARGFKNTYIEYDAAELLYEEAAYKPGLEENPVRQQVNLLLAQVLQVEMTQAERIAKAREGIAHLNDIEEQIDDIKTKGDVVAPLLASLEKRSRSIGNVTQRADIGELVTLGKRQVEIASDIRGLSYRADYYTSEIFERVIDDQGMITDDHKRYLNEQIPQLEDQFNKRANLYTELQKNRERMNQLARKLEYIGS